MSGFLRIDILALCVCCSMSSLSQEFYIDESNELIETYRQIPSEWAHLNISESYEFLKSTGFSNIESSQNGDFKIVSGDYAQNNFKLTRSFRFKDQLVEGYVDQIQFLSFCSVCMTNKAISKVSGNKVMQDILNKSREENEIKDKTLRDRVLTKFHEICESEGLYDLRGNSNSQGYDIQNSKISDGLKVTRTCKVEEEGTFFTFSLARIVSLIESEYIVGPYNLKEIETFDLERMVRVFLADCELNGLLTFEGDTQVRFESLEEDLLGLSYGQDNDRLIKLVIDPKKWSESSIPKRWYLLYHELGHDVLNLDHGQGGKMMFNFADRGYSWNEFWVDKTYMMSTKKGK